MIKIFNTVLKSTIDMDTGRVATDIVSMEKVERPGQAVFLAAALAGVLDDEACKLKADELFELRNVINEACDNNAARCTTGEGAK